MAGMGMMQGMAASNTVIQTIVTEDKRGRVMSYYTMAFMGMAPFGSLLAGTMATAVGAPLSVIMNGAAIIVGAVWFATRLPGLRREIRPIYQRDGHSAGKGRNTAMSDEMAALKLDARHTAVVVIDLQKGIVGRQGAPYPQAAVVANCARLLAAARAAGAQPVLVHVGGAPDGADRLHTATDQPMEVNRPDAAGLERVDS